MSQDAAYSRPEASAVRLGDFAPDRHLFIGKRVLLTGEPKGLETENGKDCLLNSLQLLIRISSNVSVCLPSTEPELGDKCRALADTLAFGGPVQFSSKTPALEHYDAILNIGSRTCADLPWTTINSNGWTARVSSGPTNLPPESHETNPVTALAAATLGVGEVFKRLIALKPERGLLFDDLAFNLYRYCCAEGDSGPRLPSTLPIDLLIVGAGAIGNGIVHLLGRLPTTGRVCIVDEQEFRPENLGTCLLLGPSHIGVNKAVVAATSLNARLDAKAFPEDLTAFRSRLGVGVPYPQVVVNALDSIEARHAVQALWPDVIIDGAISDFGCQVSRHPWGKDIACLICLFRRPSGEPAERFAAKVTGLREGRIAAATERVTDQDVQSAPAEKRGWLGERLGRPICSVVQEAVARQIAGEEQRKDFQPSVPFVACLSASMVVAELVKLISGWPTPLEPRFQLDVLRASSPKLGVKVVRRREPSGFGRSNGP